MASFDTIAVTLSQALVGGGSLTVNYPAGRSRGDYLLGDGHRLSWNGVQLKFPNDFTLTLNAASVVFNIAAATQVTIPSGSVVFLQLDRAGGRNTSFNRQLSDLSAICEQSGVSAAPANFAFVSMGSPLASDVAAVCASQTPAAIGALVINGTRATTGKAYLDVPRNVSLTTGASMAGYTVQVLGVDVFGKVLREDITGPGSATTVLGKKAFSRVDSATVVGTGGALPAVQVGAGVVLGLPFYLAATKLVIVELQDGVAPGTPGTFVAGSIVAATATSADVRGTYAPNAAPDASKSFQLLIAAVNVSTGGDQFTG